MSLENHVKRTLVVSKILFFWSFVNLNTKKLNVIMMRWSRSDKLKNTRKFQLCEFFNKKKFPYRKKKKTVTAVIIHLWKFGKKTRKEQDRKTDFYNKIITNCKPNQNYLHRHLKFSSKFFFTFQTNRLGPLNNLQRKKQRRYGCTHAEKHSYTEFSRKHQRQWLTQIYNLHWDQHKWLLL